MYWVDGSFIWWTLQIEYPEIEDNTKPRHRFMSSFEQVYYIVYGTLVFEYFDTCEELLLLLYWLLLSNSINVKE